jgi:hypothetical protein
MWVSQTQTRHLSLHEPQESIAHPVDADDDPSSSTAPPIALISASIALGESAGGIFTTGCSR